MTTDKEQIVKDLIEVLDLLINNDFDVDYIQSRYLQDIASKEYTKDKHDTK